MKSLKRSSLWAYAMAIAMLGSLSGTPAGAATGVSLSPSALNFGSVTVSTLSSPQGFTVVNTGSQKVTIQGIASSSSQFQVTGTAVPITLAPGQSAPIHIVFAPTSVGSFSGSISVSLSRWSQKATSIAVSGIGVATSQTSTTTPAFQLASNPTSLSFGSVLVGALSKSQTVAITNTGNSSVTISGFVVSGSGFTASGIVTPLTLAAGQSAPLSVAFSPAIAGSVTGSVSVASNATNSPTTISLTGTGMQPQISVLPSPLAFGNAVVGTSNSQTLVIQNSGTASLTVSQATVTGQAFSLSGWVLPLSVAPGNSGQFTLSFAPTSATSFSGSLSLVSNAPGSPTIVGLSGAGLAQTLQLSVAPTSVGFANTAVGTSTSQAVTISNTGNSNVSVTQIGVSGTSYSVSVAALPISLSAGQSTSITVVFSPLSTGSLAGSITIVSNAANSPATVALGGSGVQASPHSASLSWSDSSTSLAGFNIYRGTTTGGPYARVNSALVPANTYTDTSVQSGATYYYVTTAVDTTGLESPYSNESVAVIP